ncbi:MAG TPA: GNAT family N-acetyltransferase [Vitreimonas sp.]|uniref:GNAT family N-acetyltransferase n=1 Tax=Vitreimonas sp. TaxID=3069702 RepID=UPI002D39B5F2|nr:GNAT family N-acetyltransferase [Vitreimonas sp.]HYD86287.1 GNAT family N-acetyltransferase [Vitreimonas sp.]
MRDVRTIETERLALRGLRMSDAPRVAELCGDPGVARMILRAPLPYLPVAAEGWIMTLAARKPLAEEFVFAVERGGEMIGCIGAHKSGEAFEVGYWFGRAYWGRGFASETLAGFMAGARSLGRLEAGHFVDNPASGRVLEKAGFVYTGEVKPMFSMARGESAMCKRMTYAAEARAAAA